MLNLGPDPNGLDGGVGNPPQRRKRRDGNGEIISEVQQISGENKIDIRVCWKENGWKVRPLSNMLLNEGQETGRYRCSKGDVTIEASFHRDETTGIASVVLVRIN